MEKEFEATGLHSNFLGLSQRLCGQVYFGLNVIMR